MPTLRGITISLQSQYDGATIPELVCLPLSEDSPGSSSISSLDGCNTLNVSIPRLPSSQFWLSYSCVPPVDNNISYFYFKLFTGGKGVLSWGVGEQEKWSGKTVYALFGAGTDFEGRRLVEKRGLFFPRANENGSAKFEISIFRAKARKREAVKYEGFRDLADVDTGFDLTNTGRVKKGEKPRMYTYALIDPKDEPYVTFRYTIRKRRESIETNSDASASSRQPFYSHDASPSQDTLPARTVNRRLSVPPTRKLVSTTSNAEPTSPIKKLPSPNNSFPTGNLDSAETQRRDWVVRTPSPMVSRLFDGPNTPPAERRKVGSGRLLKSVVMNALKRKDDYS